MSCLNNDSPQKSLTFMPQLTLQNQLLNIFYQIILVYAFILSLLTLKSSALTEKNISKVNI